MIEDTVEELIELVYHSAAVSADGYVQERAVRAGIWDLLEDFEKAIRREDHPKETRSEEAA